MRIKLFQRSKVPCPCWFTQKAHADLSLRDLSPGVREITKKREASLLSSGGWESSVFQQIVIDLICGWCFFFFHLCSFYCTWPISTESCPKVIGHISYLDSRDGSRSKGEGDGDVFVLMPFVVGVPTFPPMGRCAAPFSCPVKSFSWFTIIKGIVLDVGMASRKSPVLSAYYNFIQDSIEFWALTYDVTVLNT